MVLLAWPMLAWADSAPLPAMGADLTRSSVSGISSGGFMASQLATAYSASFIGVGVIAAGPYYCAGTYPQQSFLKNATAACMRPLDANSGANAATSLRKAQAFASADLIDPPSHLARQRVYVFSGASDTTVKTIVSQEVARYYRLAATPASQIEYQSGVNAGHSIVTDRKNDVPCAETAPPYINNCGFMQSHRLLRHIYGEPSQPASDRPGGDFITFRQSEFVRSPLSSMDEDAYAYIPRYCRDHACAVHVAFHGCQQGASLIGERFYKGTGYAEFADTNQLIVLYPQAHPSKGIPANPEGCWDFWGYSDEDKKQPAFHTRRAPQMAAVMAMIRRLGQARSSQP
ncbi:hypothetical protein ACZ75_20290 [Massilia sp. NR 4-1]|nr:hypothetical protein ACZ75_20290 [Massilia sp. NR 4-1]